MNVRYDAPKDELVVDMRDPIEGGANGGLQTDVDADGHIIAIRIPSISHLLIARAPGSVSEHKSLDELAATQGIEPRPFSDFAGCLADDIDDTFDRAILDLRLSQGAPGVNESSDLPN